MGSNDIKRMSRRRFSKMMAGLGLTGTTFSSISKTAIAEAGIDIENEKPVLKGYVHENHEEVVNGGQQPRRRPVYYGVPNDQWVKVESVRDAAAILRSELQDYGVSVGVGNTTRGQKEKPAVVVSYSIGESPDDPFRPNIDISSLRNKVPAEMSGTAGRGTPASRKVDGIPVTIRREEMTLDAGFDCNYRPVPGGCAWRTEKGNSATIGTAVYDNSDKENALVSAAHPFTQHNAQECRQNNNFIGEKIGERDDIRAVFDHPPELFDAAVINTSFDVSYRTASAVCNQTSRLPFSGVVSEQHLQYMADENHSLTKMGIATGVRSGPVEFANDTMFKADIKSKDGDSGGPYWETHYSPETGVEQRLVAGIHRGHVSYAQGTQMAEIEDRFNVIV